MKRAWLLLCASMLSSCVTTKVMQTTNTFAPPREDVTVLFMPPDVQLSVLTASGLAEPRADWTDTARANIEQHVKSTLARSSDRLVPFETSGSMPAEHLQLIRLHEAVGNTILTFKQGTISLPTKENVFDWSLGPRVRSLAEAGTADYALFIHAAGRYASGGRVATAVVAAVLLGVAMETGSQACFASLVDLETGDIVWFNIATTADSHDLRDPKESAAMIRALLEDLPI